jgi:hypothetical protein
MRRAAGAAIVGSVLIVTGCGGGGSSGTGPQTFNDTIKGDNSNVAVHTVSASDQSVLVVTVDSDPDDLGLTVAVLADKDYATKAKAAGAHIVAASLDRVGDFSDASDAATSAAGDRVVLERTNSDFGHTRLAVPVLTKGSFLVMVGSDNGQGGKVTIHTEVIQVGGSVDDVNSRASQENSSSS